MFGLMGLMAVPSYHARTLRATVAGKGVNPPSISWIASSTDIAIFFDPFFTLVTAHAVDNQSNQSYIIANINSFVNSSV